MAEKKVVNEADKAEVAIAKARDFWQRNSKLISIVFVVVLLGIGGYYFYKNFILAPKEEKAVDAFFRAEEYYRMDSLNLALNGDGQNAGFLKIISQYGGTDAGNLACFYAGVSYIRLDNNQNAIKYLKKFSTSSKPIKARVYKLLADANADMGKFPDALDYYKKSAHHFEEDMANSAEALFMAAYLADRMMKNTKEAIALYKEVKEKYPNTAQSIDAENYLAQLEAN